MRLPFERRFAPTLLLPLLTLPGSTPAVSAGAGRADVAYVTSASFPSGATQALVMARRNGAAVQTVAITPGGEYLVVFANRTYASPGFPAEVLGHVRRYAAEGKGIDVVSFSRTGQWLIIADDWLRRHDLPSSANTRIRDLQGRGVEIGSFAFSPLDVNGWVLTAGGRAYSGGRLPDGMSAAIQAATEMGRSIHHVAVASSGAWVVVAESWFASGGLPADLRGALETMRTEDQRRIGHVFFASTASTTYGWAVVSNAAEKASSDHMSQIENGLTSSNASIYQRMKAHDITGLSIAVVESNRVAVLRTYGLRRQSDAESYVYPGTVFEAASVSKPVTAAAALRLVQAGQLPLNDRKILGTVGKRLWNVSTASGATSLPRFMQQFDDADDIDLARILTHCAGVLYDRQLAAPIRSGAEAFSAGARLPSLQQKLIGDKPARSAYRPRQSAQIAKPGTTSIYSGANYLLAQAVIEAYATGGYDGQMARLLSDLRMSSSTFDSPAPAARSNNFAFGHSGGQQKALKAYVAKGAASLSTTAEDLAHFAIMLNTGGFGGRQILDAKHREGLAGREPSLAASCTKPATMGLGLRSNSAGTRYHRGTHNGYRAYVFARPDDEWGLAILMTGGGIKGADVNAFAKELLGSVRAEYNLPKGSLPW